jgi:putative ABC transport system permease protein
MLKIGLIIFEQSLLYMPLALGAYLSISLMKLPDLSIESAYTFGAILASKYLLIGHCASTGVTLFITIVLAMAGGMLVGCTSSLLTQKAKIPHLLSSILAVGVFHGINQAVLGTSIQSLAALPNPLIRLSGMTTNQELTMIAAIGALIIVALFFFLKTQLGFCLAVYGNNPQFFEHHKISGTFIFFVGVLVANSLAGLSGYLVAQTSSFVDITMGIGMSLFAITTLILGKTIIRTRKPITILMPLGGVAGYFAIQQILLMCSFDLKYFTMLQAMIVLIILGITYRKKQTSRGQQTTDTLGV